MMQAHGREAWAMAGLALMLGAGPAAAQAAAQGAPTMARTPAGEVSFAPFAPGDAAFEGLGYAVLYGGGYGSGEPSGILMRFPPLDPVPHAHGSDYHGVVVEGRFHHWLPGEPEGPALGPGATWFQAAGVLHADRCAGPEACLILLHFPDGWDVVAPTGP